MSIYSGNWMTSNKAFMEEGNDSDVTRTEEHVASIVLPQQDSLDRRRSSVSSFPSTIPVRQETQDEHDQSERAFRSESNRACCSDTTNFAMTIPEVPTTDTCDDDYENSFCKSPEHNVHWQRHIAEVHAVVMRNQGTSKESESYANDEGTVYEHVEDLKNGSEGSFVSKYRVKEKQTGETIRFVAGKRMDKKFYPNFEKEIKIVKDLDKYSHPNIARFEAFGKGNDKFAVLFTELCDFSLEEYISGKPKLEDCCTMPDSSQILKYAGRAIKYLHGMHILHLDIKPSNMLFKKGSLKDGKHCYVLKIIDFGLSKKIDPDRSCASTCDVMGTRSYMSPEHHNQTPFKPGKHPFGAKENAIAFHIEEYMEQPSLEGLVLDNKEDEVLARDLILRMIQKLPEDRPTIEEVEIHPYFWSSHKKKIFYMASNDVIQKRTDDAKFLKSLNEVRKKNQDGQLEDMTIEDLNLPKECLYSPKKTDKDQQSPKYSNVETYILFLRNWLVHCRPDESKQLERQKSREAQREHLTDDVEIRLPKLTKPYPRLLHHLYYLLQKEKSFRDAFKKDAKIDLTKVTSVIWDPKVKATA